MLKRILDIVGAGVGLIVLSPLFVIITLLVRRRMGPPAIFTQQRAGLNGRPFTLYKFRSMTNARDENGELLPDEERLTPFGQFLRRTSIDELPQLWNVLKGDMSVVGPRSERPEFVANFEKEIPGYSQRFAVKAGITGLAQVAGNYDTTPQDKLRYDLLYIKNYSVLQDLKIMFLTVRAVFSPHLYNRTFEDNKQTFISSDSLMNGEEPGERAV